MRKIITGMILAVISLNTYSQTQDQTVTGNLRVNHSITTNADIYVGEYNVPDKMGLGSKLHLGGNNFNTDFVWLTKFVSENNFTDLRVNIGDDDSGDDRFVIGNTVWNSGDVWKDWFVVTNQSRVGIGVSHPTCALDVAGTIRAKEVKIEATGWSDFVFDKNYDLPKLSDVEKHINDKQHLPGIPSEKEVLENGVNVVDMQAKLLQKIEELTLYVIEQDKKIEKQDNQNKDLQKQVNELKAQLNEKHP